MAKKKGGAHHGGAWKVAYADFVTAMMALFMVLWISAQDEKILIATSRYFQSPFTSPLDDHSGVMPYNKQEREGSGDDSTDTTGREKPTDSTRQIELKFLDSVAADFYRLLHLDRDLSDRPIDIQVTSDGLRITLFDRARRPVFGERDTEFTEWGRFLMQSLAWLIDRHKFNVTIDGHTRANLGLPDGDYSVWELSADRANAARRALVHYAVEPGLIERVTGYADTVPLPNVAADAESNQRITISLRLTARGREPEPAKLPTAPDTGAPPPVATTTPPSPAGTH